MHLMLYPQYIACFAAILALVVPLYAAEDCSRWIVKPDNNRPQVWVAVFGVPGAGKSQFIREFVGSDSDALAPVSHSLKSVAPEIVISRWPQKERDLVLVDTPGFEDTNRTSDKVLRLVSEKFADLYRCGISINASIYLHPMTEARMQPGSIMNLSTFKSLVGEAKWRSVILLTTRWDTVEKADGVKKENELRNTKQFWGDLVDGGATIMQHNRRDRMSARNVLDKTVEFATPTPLQVQEEIVSQGLPSDRTEATFSFMFYNNHQQLLDDIEAEFKMVGTAAESLQVHRKDSLYWGNNMALLQQTLYDFANSEWLKKATITAAILIATAEIQNRYPEIGKMLSSSRETGEPPRPEDVAKYVFERWQRYWYVGGDSNNKLLYDSETSGIVVRNEL
ncbi:hypothetical protein RBB50_004890 [Rhinocladiella similis]